jgi:hypothetical protein
MIAILLILTVYFCWTMENEVQRDRKLLKQLKQ